MEKSIDKTLTNFLDDENIEVSTKKVEKENFSKTLKTKDGLIERVDKKLIVEDGRQMLLD